MDTSETQRLEGRRRNRRRRHSDEFKAQAVQACMHPGVSIASVALARGLNANMLRRLVHDAEQSATSAGRVDVVAMRNGSPTRAVAAAVANGFVQLPMPVLPAVGAGCADTAAASTSEHAPNEAASIFVEIQRAETSIYITWPTSAAAPAAAWLRELLR
jgi:transposase